MDIKNFIQEIDLQNEGLQMHNLMERLYPIFRSITGNGVRETLSILREFIPVEVIEIPSGTKVYDWIIPDEWNIEDAWIKNPNGEKIIDIKKLNLHLLNYSEPVQRQVDLEELKKHLYTLPESPDWVPYRTSYYNRKWGFCMAHNQFEKLADGNYEVYIDSEIKPGALTYGELLVPGKSKEEVLFSCHICHPSLCNDNLSGIVIATKLAWFIRKLNLKYSYRFLFVPGTIGAIAWLNRNEKKLSQIKHGLVLSLLGDPSPFQYKKSRHEVAEVDAIMSFLLRRERNSKVLEFSPYGYDERQFCSPGINLPVGRLTRTPFSEFPEYHTSADNLTFVQPENLGESLDLLLRFVNIVEKNRKMVNLNPKGEPQLGKRGLYNKEGGNSKLKDYQMALLWVLNYSDGNYSLLDIAVKSGIGFDMIDKAASDLENCALLKDSQVNDTYKR